MRRSRKRLRRGGGRHAQRAEHRNVVPQPDATRRVRELEIVEVLLGCSGNGQAHHLLPASIEDDAMGARRLKRGGRVSRVEAAAGYDGARGESAGAWRT